MMTISDIAPGSVVCVLLAKPDGTAEAWQGVINRDHMLEPRLWRRSWLPHRDVDFICLQSAVVLYDLAEDVLFVDSPLWKTPTRYKEATNDQRQ
jgi:hypothetical protein